MPILSDQQMASYHDRGYLILDAFFGEDELRAFTAAALSIIRNYIDRATERNPERYSGVEPGDEFDAGMALLGAHDRDLFDEVYDTLWRTPTFLRLVAKPQIEAVANAILGRDEIAPLYGFINRCRITLSNDKASYADWHREIFQTVPGAPFVQIWAPVIRDASINTGAPEVCIASHRTKIPKPPWAENSGGVCKVFFDDNVVAKFAQTSFDLKLGQAAFFDGKLLHRSGRNTSGLARYAMVGLFHDVHDSNFHPPKMRFEYRKTTPQDYFDSLPNNF